MPAKIDLTGQKFGRLTVLKYSEEYSKIKKRRCYKCQCDCGNITYVTTMLLRSGRTQSCGCLQKEIVQKIGQNNFQDISGQKFGRLTAIKYNEELSKKYGATYWDFRCDCGNTKSLRSCNVLRGKTISCGCLNMSRGEFKIQQILKNNNINFKKEYIFKDFKSPKNEFFRFDFAIFSNDKLSYIIEFNGEQHYKSVPFFEQKVSFEERIKYDDMKKAYLKQHNIPLVIIKFDEEITSDKIIRRDLL